MGKVSVVLVYKFLVSNFNFSLSLNQKLLFYDFVPTPGLHEFQALKNSEINDFRWKMKNLGDEVARTRVNKSWLERLYYQFPPRLADPGIELPQNVTSRLRDGSFVLVTRLNSEQNEVSLHSVYPCS